MVNDSSRIQPMAQAVHDPAHRAYEAEPGEFGDAIGYESADPSLQGPQWFEARQHGQPAPGHEQS